VPNKEKTDPDFNFTNQVAFSADGEEVLALDTFPNLYRWRWKTQPRADQEISYGGQLDHAYFVAPGVFAGYGKKGPLQLYRVGKDGVRRFATVPTTLTIAGDYPPFQATRDARHLVVWNPRDAVVEVHDITTDPPRVVDKVVALVNHPFARRGLRIKDVCLTPDRSLVIAAYGDKNTDDPRTALACVAFFPRTPARYREFGLDSAKHTHLLLSIEILKRYDDVPLLCLSPDGNWLFFLQSDFFEPRFWDVRRLGELLRADKRVQKR
jgi:hypothetical protein